MLFRVNLDKKTIKGKSIPLWPTGRCGSKGSHIYIATVLGRGRLTCPMIGRLCRRLSRSQDQSGHEGVKKYFHPSDTQGRTGAIQPVVKRLAA